MDMTLISKADLESVIREAARLGTEQCHVIRYAAERFAEFAHCLAGGVSFGHGYSQCCCTGGSASRMDAVAATESPS